MLTINGETRPIEQWEDDVLEEWERKYEEAKRN